MNTKSSEAVDGVLVNNERRNGLHGTGPLNLLSPATFLLLNSSAGLRKLKPT